VTEPNQEESPFGQGWRITIVVVLGIVVVALVIMAWILLTH